MVGKRTWDNLVAGGGEEVISQSGDIYSAEYYASMRGGHEEGKAVFYRNALKGVVGRIEGKVVLDVGCGRGELVELLLHAGAAGVVAVDFSSVAVDLTCGRLESAGMDPARYEVRQWDITAPNPAWEGRFDFIFMLDVIEHLPKGELEKGMANCRTMLKEQGEIHFHTFPTRCPHRLLLALLAVAKPAKKREIESIHSNVQTRRSLAAVFAESRLGSREMRLENDLLSSSSFYYAMRPGIVKSLLKFFFTSIPAWRWFRTVTAMLGMEEFFYMSIYGVAVKYNGKL